MKRSLFIQLDSAIIEQDTGEELKFAPGIIHNLYRISQQLGYELFFWREKKDSNELYSKALSILERDEVRFEVTTDITERENQYGIIRQKTNFEITENKNIVHVISWDEIYNYLKSSLRQISHSRNTNETKIQIEINIDGSGKYDISTGLGFFDHMLEQFSKHSSIDLYLHVQGDLHIDEHHTIEDSAIALGEAVLQALGNKKGIERYGFLLPMDDCLAQVAIDFGGRSWLVWNADFKREFIGDVPTEMFYHFFKSFCDGAKCNLNIKAEGTNEHHKIESIFKAFAKAVKMAVAVNFESASLPTTKGIL